MRFGTPLSKKDFYVKGSRRTRIKLEGKIWGASKFEDSYFLCFVHLSRKRIFMSKAVPKNGKSWRENLRCLKVWRREKLSLHVLKNIPKFCVLYQNNFYIKAIPRPRLQVRNLIFISKPIPELDNRRRKKSKFLYINAKTSAKIGHLQDFFCLKFIFESGDKFYKEIMTFF